MNSNKSRRELATRKQAWAQSLGRFVSRSGVSPNAISIISIGFSLLVPIFLYFFSMDSKTHWLLGSAAAIQLRLLCNMLDGLVAVEGGKKSPLGDLYNDVPDRIADVLIIVGMGLASPMTPFLMSLVWLNSVGAVFTAYLRFMGASLAGEHRFLGPQAKQHRMFLCTLILLLGAGLTALGADSETLGHFLQGSMTFMLVGIIITCYRRLSWVAHYLNSKAN